MSSAWTEFAGLTPRLSDALSSIENLPRVRDAIANGQRIVLRPPQQGVFLSRHRRSRPQPYVYIPGLPEQPFYDTAEHPWVEPIENGFDGVKSEFLALLHAESGLKTYKNEHGFVLPSWNTFNLYFGGTRIDENCARCPQTSALVESLPRLDTDHIMFSALNPRSHIPPHVGPMNGILRAHLPLIVPDGCRIKVAKEERHWTEGRVLLLDDTFVHEVWNPTAHARVVLFLNFWHPDLDDEEVECFRELRAAIQETEVEQAMLGYQLEERPSTFVLHDNAPAIDTTAREFPRILDLELTNRCNLDCQMCPRPANMGNMNKALLDGILDEALEYPEREFRLHGIGEPLIAPLFSHAVHRIKSHPGGHRIHLTTNGHHLDKETRKLLRSYAVDSVNISVAAATAETYKQIRRSDRFDRVLRNTVAMIEQRDRYGIPMDITVQIIRVPPGDSQVDAFIEMWSKFDVIIEVWDDMFRGRLRGSDAPGPCRYLWDYTLVTWDGFVQICCVDPLRAYQVGNANDQSIDEWYNGPQIQAIRDFHLQRRDDEAMPICRNCSFRDDQHIAFTGNVHRTGERPEALAELSRLPIYKPN
ncbi:MAG: aspartyl/asparaginyl beta-hydroxylase domain-containing protein [Myxococcota bacterium]